MKIQSDDYIQFTYDGNTQRVKKYNYTTGQSVLYFGELYEIRSGAGTIHLFAGNRRVASVFSDGTTQFYHTNHLGSASVISDQNGVKKEKIEYFPFGAYREAVDYDPNFPDVFYTFTGQEDDDDLGLYNFKARLYDPLLGRFISPDGVVPDPEDPQAHNRYSYALNNPLRYNDPSGHAAPQYHLVVTALAAYMYGSSPDVCRKQAFEAMWVDFSLSAFKKEYMYTNIHGMAGVDPVSRNWQTTAEAIQGTIGVILRASASGNLAIADHATLDLATHRGESMALYGDSFANKVEHWKRDINVPSYVQDWAAERMVINREIRDYYQQFDQNAGYVPGPVTSFGSLYDLATLGTGLSASSFDYWSSGSNSALTTLDLYLYNTNWSILSFGQWSYSPSQDVSLSWSYYEWNYW